MTYKSRVEDFWRWFESIADRFHKAIEDGHCPSLQGETAAAVDNWLNGIDWVYGPGVAPHEHSLTLSPNGNLHRQFLTDYWVERAPALNGWRFYSSRQPSTMGSIIEIHGQKFGREEMWVAPVPAQDQEVINVTVWHPKFSTLNEQERQMTTFLWLDEVLGEHGTANWIGSLKINAERLRESVLLNELPGYIKDTADKNNWTKYPPGKAYSSYSLKDHSGDYLRSDTIAGSTCNFRLFRDYFSNHGNLEDPLAGFDADFIFVSFPAEFLPAGQEAAARGKIEDALEQSLDREKTGKILGGATGIKNGYIDAIIFDGDNSLANIHQTLKSYPNLTGASLHYFATNKRHLSLTV